MLNRDTELSMTCEVSFVCYGLLQISSVESAPAEVSFFHVSRREVPSPEILVGMYRLSAESWLNAVRFYTLTKKTAIDQEKVAILQSEYR